ncbi:MAG: 30S ribosomal protein S10 [Candidatus Pacebacteria bacterium]|nr:30S ribosomal protein S10 [Candidatus Paceibacterota bacterium]
MADKKDQAQESKATKAKADNKDFKTRMRIKIKAFDHKIIDQSTKTIMEVASRNDETIFGPIPLPVEKRKYTVNRSTFVHKDARDQYEMRVHKRLIDIIEPNQKTIEDLSSLNLPAGVDVEIKMQ